MIIYPGITASLWYFNVSHDNWLRKASYSATLFEMFLNTLRMVFYCSYTSIFYSRFKPESNHCSFFYFRSYVSDCQYLILEIRVALELHSTLLCILNKLRLYKMVQTYLYHYHVSCILLFYFCNCYVQLIMNTLPFGILGSHVLLHIIWHNYV